MEEEIKQEFEKIWKRIEEIENRSDGSEIKETKEKKKETAKKEYKGLSGGIRLLSDENFLDQPKTVNEIWHELKRQGYHYPKKSVSKLLSINFMKNQRLLTRVREEKKWKYVIRK